MLCDVPESVFTIQLHPIPWWYAAWLAFVVVQRLVELWISSRHLRQSEVVRAREAEGRASWIAMIAVHSGLIALPALEVALFERRVPSALSATMFALFLGAQLLRYAAIRALGSAWNARGSVDRALVVVDRGPYRWIRHPNYVAVIVEFVTVPLGGGAWMSCLVLGVAHAFVLARRIRGEEALLAEVPGYRESMGSKGRFWPRWNALKRVDSR